MCFVKTENQDRIKEYTSGISNDWKKRKNWDFEKEFFFSWIQKVNKICQWMKPFIAGIGESDLSYLHILYI